MHLSILPRSRVATILIALTLLVAAMPALGKSREKILQETLRTYAATIRWGSIEQAESFVDPDYREAHPLTPLELERFRHVRISAYNERAAIPINDNEVRQTVEIGIVNVNTQEARTVLDHQTWKFDKKSKTWRLTSGLPDITRRN
jgi:hypothetical protein